MTSDTPPRPPGLEPRPAEVEPTAVPPGAPAAGAPTPAVGPEPHVVRRTRTSALWAGLWAGAVFLVLLLVFVLQNLDKVKVSFFGLKATVPLAVALLLAAVLGVLLVLVPGTVRMVQLRRTARRHRRAEAPRG